MKDLGSATRHATQTRVNQILKDTMNRLFGEKLKPIDFDRRPRFQVQLRERIVQNTNRIDVPVVIPLMMQSADYVHFGTAVVHRFTTTIQDLVIGHGVALGIAEVRSKRTEGATIDTYIRRVKMGVNVIVRVISVDTLTDKISQLTQFVERDIVLVQPQPVLQAESLADLDFFTNSVPIRQFFDHHDSSSRERGKPT